MASGSDSSSETDTEIDSSDAGDLQLHFPYLSLHTQSEYIGSISSTSYLSWKHIEPIQLRITFLVLMPMILQMKVPWIYSPQDGAI